MAFTELNPELEDLLKELQDVRSRGESVEAFVRGKLDAAQVRPDAGGKPDAAKDGLDRAELYGAYMDLVDAGYVRRELPPYAGLAGNRAGVDYRFTDLTSDGRSYFEMKDIRERRKEKKILSNRRFQIIITVVTILLSGVAAVAGSAWVNFCWQPSSEIAADYQSESGSYSKGHGEHQGEPDRQN